MKIYEVKTLPIGVIRPHWRNPRRITNEAIKKVAKSIKDYGFAQPIVIDKDNVIVAGHVRYKAAIELGLKEVPCIILDIDAKKAKEYRIIDNRTGEITEWDLEDLKIEIREIDSDEINFYFDNEFNFDADSEEVTFNSVTGKEINKSKAEIDNRYKQMSDKLHDKYVPLSCPVCGEGFSIRLEDIIVK